jgi:pyruvate,water dikinase
MELAGQSVNHGQLPDVESLWMLRIDEARWLDSGWVADEENMARRKREIEWLRGCHLPELIHRFDDLEVFHTKASAESSARRLSGTSLTTGDVQGRAWVLDEPSVDLPDGFKLGDTILVARSVDSGWIPTFSMVAGVVVETGGDLSHGSIILREIGLPAITNVHGATRHFKTGERLILRAGSGSVERAG